MTEVMPLRVDWIHERIKECRVEQDKVPPFSTTYYELRSQTELYQGVLEAHALLRLPREEA